MADKADLLVICGPTATGKTALSVALAKKLNGEIICADSMQIYKGLTIGTAKVTLEEMQGVPHYLVDFLPPEKTFSVADYVEAANRCIAEISARGKLPILVGGTGLYIQSVVKGVRFTEEKTDPALRQLLQNRAQAEGIEALLRELEAADPDYARGLHPNNRGRILRALELYLQTGKTMTEQLAQSLPAQRPYNDVIIGLNYAQREALYTAINMRVERMLEQGLLAEAKTVWEHKEAYLTAAQAIGYKEFFGYFEDMDSLAQCTDRLKQASRNYAKRQLTWFRRMEEVQWLVAGDTENVSAVLQRMAE